MRTTALPSPLAKTFLEPIVTQTLTATGAIPSETRSASPLVSTTMVRQPGLLWTGTASCGKDLAVRRQVALSEGSRPVRTPDELALKFSRVFDAPGNSHPTLHNDARWPLTQAVVSSFNKPGNSTIVVQGTPRCGKSVLLHTVAATLKAQNKDVVTLSFATDSCRDMARFEEKLSNKLEFALNDGAAPIPRHEGNTLLEDLDAWSEATGRTVLLGIDEFTPLVEKDVGREILRQISNLRQVKIMLVVHSVPGLKPLVAEALPRARFQDILPLSFGLMTEYVQTLIADSAALFKVVSDDFMVHAYELTGGRPIELNQLLSLLVSERESIAAIDSPEGFVSNTVLQTDRITHDVLWQLNEFVRQNYSGGFYGTTSREQSAILKTVVAAQDAPGTALPLAADYPAADLEHLYDIGWLVCDAQGCLSAPGILLRTAIANFKLS